MKVKYIVLLLVAIVPDKLFSQGGSNYSSIGIGDLFPSTNAAYQAIGSTFISVPAENSINVKNPAMWSVASSTRILLGYNFNQHLNETSDETLLQNNGKISGLFTIFNIDKSLGISVCFGLHSYSNINYLVSNKFTIEKDGLTQTGKNTFQGSGGLSSAYLGASAKIIDNLAVGASTFAVFGPIKNSVYTEFDDYYSYNYEVIKSDYATSWGARFGAYYNYENLHIGAFYEYVDDIKFKRETQFSSTVITDTIIKSSFTEKFPSQYGVGLSYKTGKFLLSSDFMMMKFKDFGYNSISNSEFTDAYKLSFGAIRYGSASRFSDLLDRINYKAGIYYQKLYYKINNQDIKELGVSLGGEIPLGSGGILDVAVVLGNRGKANDYLINEYFGRLFVEISVGEIWFKPFKRRYE
jgi:hypothetical protein